LPSIAHFTELIERQQLTVLNLPTAYWHEWVAALEDAPAPLPPSLRLVVVGGEAASGPRLRQWQARAGERVDWLNCYGPTETTAGVTFGRVGAHELMHIGQPIANTRLYLLDIWGEPVPVGVAGEIHIGGAQVARGYLNRAELTAERFIPDPYTDEPGARMFRTGDLGRWRHDGTIECLGRTDEQVKVRGFRIEPAEIEARLLAHPGVREAVVLAREDAPGHKRFVAYLTGDPALPRDSLRAHLVQALPEYMVPAAYVQLDALPLTPNGKLDRRALPAPSDTAFARHAHEAPQGGLEATLASIWSQLLGVDRIGRHDDFFALGGHSLLAVQLLSRIRTALGLDVPLAELFAQPTLAGFAERVAAATASALPAIVPASRQEALPVSFAQQRLWFLAQLDERAGAAYSMPGGVRLKGSLDTAALHAALNRIVARHEALRTCFASVDGAPVQVIAPPEVGLALAHVDLSGHANPEAELERLAAGEAGAPFDLASGPLIRGRLIRLADDDHALLVTMHHIVSDGWSEGVLLNEFSALYAAYAQGEPDPLAPLAIQYADYAVWQRRWITGEVLQHQLNFWRHHLSGAPALLELPTDRPRPPVQDYAGASIGFEFDAELTAHLKALSRRHGTTLFMTLLASWAALLARLSGQSDIVIGTPVANRHRAEVEPLIGFFVNTQALRIDLSGSPSVAELLAQTRSTALTAQAHQDIPFEQVVEALSPTRSMAHSPIFQVMFAWQNAAGGSLELPGLDLEPVRSSSTTVKFDLELTLHDTGERIAGSLGYACALFDRATVERSIAHWRTLLSALVADDEVIVARLPLWPDDEQHQLLHGVNATAASFPAERCIQELFEAQVERTPEATALVFEGTSLTYAELNAQANRLAQHLLTLGVQPDSRVAIALPRNLDMVVAVLGTLKAGGAYVPLDPDYPVERLAFMLADSAPRVLITHSNVQPTLGVLPPSLAVLSLDAPTRPWQTLPAVNPDLRARGLTSSHLAYVIYTSGSTGLPKGVMVEHAQVVRLFEATSAWFDFNAQDVWTLFHSCAFDFSVWELWGALLHGGRLVVVPHLTARSPHEFYELLCDQQVTVLNQTPSAFRQLISAQADSDRMHHLRCVIFGGEALAPSTLSPWYARNGERTRLVNMYGITETTVHVTYRPLSPEDTQCTSSPIGVRIPDLRVMLLDAHGQPVPIGVPGELYVGGAGVTRGYLGRPDLTAERFVPDPFGEPGSRTYRTGDLGRWRPDGTIKFMGRNDHQVKVRGFRIELGEIEAALRAHPEVREAVVLAREDAPGDQRLVAYIVGNATPEALRAHLSARLPDYMVPAAYVAQDALPLTPNGKLDRAALPAPLAAAVRPNPYEPPRMGIERVLARAWSKVLNLAVIGREDHFFELGGHSLLAVRLVADAKQRGLGLTLQHVYAYPTLRAQAARLLGAEHSSDTEALAVRRTGTAPTLFALPTGMGDVTYAFELTAHLDTDAPVYALPWPDVMPESMDALAADMVRIMRVVQPAGPYRLLGYSSGALLAYAMAQLLAEQDELVDFIGMLDCRYCTDDHDVHSPEELVRDLLTTQVDAQTSGEPEDVRQALRQVADDLLSTPLDDVVARYEHHEPLSALAAQRHTSVRSIATTYRRIGQFSKLWPRYAALALPAPMKLHVFNAVGEVAPPHPLGWDQLLPLDQIVLVPVPGTHTSMMEPPCIGHVGRAVSEALRQTQWATASVVALLAPTEI
jgi:amino acid adenylation domain-containing protein